MNNPQRENAYTRILRLLLEAEKDLLTNPEEQRLLLVLNSDGSGEIVSADNFPIGQAIFKFENQQQLEQYLTASRIGKIELSAAYRSTNASK